MSRLRQRLQEPSFILDAAQVVVAVVVGIALALDMIGLWSAPVWLSSNLLSIVFIAVCILTVSSFLERRIQIDRFSETTNQKLDRLIGSLQPGIKLAARQGYAPFEARLANARHVSLVGKSLVGILSAHTGFIRKKAQAGCKFRILVVDPAYYDALRAAGYGNQDSTTEDNLRHSIRILETVSKTTDNLQMRYIPYPPPYSLVILDNKQPHGTVQVELYTLRAIASERPHFLLDQVNNKEWYDFFAQQFDLAWQIARPLDGVEANSEQRANTE